MSVKAFALAGGILWGVVLFAFTLIEAARGAGHTLVVLDGVYRGYSVSYLGAVIGLVYGFISGALLGAAFSWLYNVLAPSAGANK